LLATIGEQWVKITTSVSCPQTQPTGKLPMDTSILSFSYQNVKKMVKENTSKSAILVFYKKGTT